MKKRVLIALLVLTIIIGMLPLGAAADDDYILLFEDDDYSLYTTSGHPWTGNAGVFTSGNAGVKNSLSTIKLIVKSEGLLKFDWTVSYKERYSFFAYRFNENYSDGANVVSQSGNKFTGDTVGSEQGLLVKTGDTLYLTYYKINLAVADESLPDTATISNIRIEPYEEPDQTDYSKPIVYDNELGSITAQIMEKKTDGEGYSYTSISDIALDEINNEGNTYRIAAKAKDGYQFYGWVQTYNYNGTARQSYKGLKYITYTEKHSENRITNEEKAITTPELEAKLDGKSVYTAVFAPAGTYIARVNSTFYDSTNDLADIIDNAQSGDTIEILKNTTLSRDATVKKGVTLYVPFRAIMGADDEAAGKFRGFGGKANEVISNKKYVTLSIDEGTTLTVKGTLAVGATVGAKTQGMQGHISGACGEIANNGKIIVNEKGTMITYGLVTGSGSVLAENYGVIKESLLISDFAGGSNTLALYTDQQIPFKRFTMQNIHCELQLERLGTLTGLISLYAIGGFNEAQADVVGVTSESIFKPNDTGVSGNNLILSRTYNPQYLPSTTGQSIGVGKTTWNVYGGLEFRSLTLNLGIATVKTDHVDFPIPPHMDFVMNDGLYDIPGKVKIMPGAHMTVAEDATLKIGKDGSKSKLLILDGLKQEAMSGYKYPTREQLSVPGYGGSAEFILNGTLRISSGSALGGLVQSTSDTGILIVEEGAYLINSTADISALDPADAVDLDVSLARQLVPFSDIWVIQEGEGNDLRFYNWVQQDGGKGGYADNTTWFNLPARIYNGNEVVKLTPGTWKSSVGSYTFTDVSHQRYCTNGSDIKSATYTEGRIMTVFDETFERTVSGIWRESTSAVEITSNTVAGSDKSGSITNGVTVDAVTVRNSDGSTTLTLTVMRGDSPAAEKYVHLVKYETATGTLTAEGKNGEYTIPAEAQSVSIETALRGDANGDGKIAMTDISALRLHILHKKTLNGLVAIAADVTGDGKLAMTDISGLRLHILGKKLLF